mmetsp:Transcript_13215/g.38119  ORF Transcript_13215/g.38119 Transcript_13215/m.38119 type:complete len:232 (+) Transcript_13215:1231-1926(+)
MTTAATTTTMVATKGATTIEATMAFAMTPIAPLFPTKTILLPVTTTCIPPPSLPPPLSGVIPSTSEMTTTTLTRGILPKQRPLARSRGDDRPTSHRSTFRCHRSPTPAIHPPAKRPPRSMPRAATARLRYHHWRWRQRSASNVTVATTTSYPRWISPEWPATHPGTWTLTAFSSCRPSRTTMARMGQSLLRQQQNHLRRWSQQRHHQDNQYRHRLSPTCRPLGNSWSPKQN